MCSPKPPKPDPLIGQAAKQNADIAQQQLDVAREQLAWEKDRAKTQDPLIQKIVDQQIASGDANAPGPNRNGKLTASCSRRSKSEWCRTRTPSIPASARKEWQRRLSRMLLAVTAERWKRISVQWNAWASTPAPASTSP